jgi:hypothetical protein
MKEPKRTYVGAAVFFERAADDGWSEDCDWWTETTGGSGAAHRCNERVEIVTRPPVSQFVKSLLRGWTGQTRSTNKSQMATN